jgi:hypothetical protein
MNNKVWLHKAIWLAAFPIAFTAVFMLATDILVRGIFKNDEPFYVLGLALMAVVLLIASSGSALTMLVITKLKAYSSCQFKYKYELAAIASVPAATLASALLTNLNHVMVPYWAALLFVAAPCALAIYLSAPKAAR